MERLNKDDDRELGNIKLSICNKEEFRIWKERVMAYMEAADPRLVSMMMRGYVPPVKSSLDNPTIMVELDVLDMNKEKITMLSFDKRACNILINVIDNATFQQLTNCRTAKSLWDKLVIYMEGT